MNIDSVNEMIDSHGAQNAALVEIRKMINQFEESLSDQIGEILLQLDSRLFSELPPFRWGNREIMRIEPVYNPSQDSVTRFEVRVFCTSVEYAIDVPRHSLLWHTYDSYVRAILALKALNDNYVINQLNGMIISSNDITFLKPND